MSVETIVPSSREEWLAARALGASDMPVLLIQGHPWQTPFGLWAEKGGLAPPRKDTQDLRLGRYVESAALKFLQDEKPDWVVKSNAIGEGGQLFVDRAAGLSCTPDAFVLDAERGAGVCNVKKVSAHAFKEKWCCDGEPRPPAYVAIQVIQEIALTATVWGCVAALVLGEFGSEFHLLDVPAHAGIMDRIRWEAADFWRRVRDADPYPVDYYRDGDLIKYIYSDDDTGEVDLSGNEEVLKLLARHEALKRIESAGGAAEKERKAIDSRIVHEFLGNAARGILGGGRVLDAKTVRRKGYAVDPSSYRPLKIRTLKERSATP